MKYTLLPNQNSIEKLFNQRKVKYAALFGSRAKGGQKANSDYDFLIEFEPENQYTLLDIISLKNSLQGLLGENVDLITSQGINPRLSKDIEGSKKVIYDDRKR